MVFILYFCNIYRVFLQSAAGRDDSRDDDIRCLSVEPNGITVHEAHQRRGRNNQHLNPNFDND